MKVQLTSPKKLVDAVSIISELVTEARLKFLEDGLSIIALDPANVAMIIFKMPKESFSNYDPSNGILTINLEDFKRVLKRSVNAGSVDLETKENQLVVTAIDKTKRIFTLSLIETHLEEKDEPTLEFSTKIEMPSIDLVQTIEDCSVVADSCLFDTEREKFSISASGSINSARSEFSKEFIKFEGEGKSKYSVEYLMKFIKSAKISENVTLKFSNNYPLRIEFVGDNMGIAFILAPRVEND